MSTWFLYSIFFFLPHASQATWDQLVDCINKIKAKTCSFHQNLSCTNDFIQHWQPKNPQLKIPIWYTHRSRTGAVGEFTSKKVKQYRISVLCMIVLHYTSEKEKLKAMYSSSFCRRNVMRKRKKNKHAHKTQQTIPTNLV